MNQIFTELDADVYGLGTFAYGISEYWNHAYQLIYNLASKYNSVDVCFEDDYTKINKLNGVIKNKEFLKLAKMYHYYQSYPLAAYVNNRLYDSAEFLNFIEKITQLNSYGKRIRFFGIAPITQQPSNNNNVNTNYTIAYAASLSNDEVEFDIKKFYDHHPEFIKDNSAYKKYVINNFYNSQNKEMLLV
jgi:hypothetical protein